MKFTVIIPLYNKGAYIKNTLKSVLAQTFQNFEIIVINDGSTDDSVEIVRSVNDSRIRLINKPNGGVSSARNFGIQAASGDWVAFLDADDWEHPNYLLTLSKLTNDYPQIDVVATKYRSLVIEDGAAIEAWPIAETAQAVELITDLPNRWLKGTSFFTSSIAIRRTILEKISPCFPEGESFGEDLDLWFRVGEISVIALSDAPLVARVLVPDGLSIRYKTALEAPYLLRMSSRATRIGFPKHLVESTLRFVDETRMTLARSAITSNNRRMAFSLLWRARRSLRSARWWFTVGMALILPSRFVRIWQSWRERRTMIL